MRRISAGSRQTCLHSVTSAGWQPLSATAVRDWMCSSTTPAASSCRARKVFNGIEMTWALNHLSYYLLTDLVLPQLSAGHPARIVNVASDAHKGASIDFDDVLGKRRYSPWRAYKQSKLANILFTYELARRLEGTSVTVNALHPGFVRTNIFRHPTWKAWLVRRAADLIALSPERGAQTSIYLASSPDVANFSGRYFVKQKPTTSSPQSLDGAAAARLWDLSQKMTGA